MDCPTYYSKCYWGCMKSEDSNANKMKCIDKCDGPQCEMENPTDCKYKFRHCRKECQRIGQDAVSMHECQKGCMNTKCNFPGEEAKCDYGACMRGCNRTRATKDECDIACTDKGCTNMPDKCKDGKCKCFNCKDGTSCKCGGECKCDLNGCHCGENTREKFDVSGSSYGVPNAVLIIAAVVLAYVAYTKLNKH